jgi:hypothetical protein
LVEDQRHIINETQVAKLSFYALIGNMWRDGRIVIDPSHSRLTEAQYMFTNYPFLKPLDTQLGV